MKYFALLLFFCCCLYSAFAQNTITGIVKDETGKPLEAVSVVIEGTRKGTVSDKNGNFELSIPNDSNIIIVFSFLGYEVKKQSIEEISIPLEISLKQQAIEIDEITIEENDIRDKVGMQKIDIKTFQTLPNTSGNIESILKTLPGVTSNNELSSQYSVRGGNFDENLVYVNDFEIYRPFLVRSGQQEGLTFTNPDLVSNIFFSSGGFEAKYGDKMSSVLDVKYKKPDVFHGSVSGSLLGANAHLEGSNKSHKLHYLVGLRHKTNQYLLNGLDVQGSYKPAFTDIQGLINYESSSKLEWEWIGNYSRNKFQFVPEDQETEFGVVNNVLRLKVFFEGQEIDEYETFMTGISSTYKPKNNLRLKWLASVYGAREQETFDIIGQYWLDAIESNLGDEDFGQVKYNLGVGTFHNNARNFLNALVTNVGHKGYFSKRDHYIQWGARIQYEYIDDELKEWTRLDSADYSLPHNGQEVLLSEVSRSQTTLNSLRYTGYIEDAWSINDANNLTLNGGVRFQYWDLNEQFMVSPRVQLSFQPKWERDIVLRFAWGIYNQSPFYRELRDLYGTVNTNVKAQRAIHYVAGADWNFKAWGRPFKFVTELYYKDLNKLNPYEVANVRIRYYGDNTAVGYAAGVDFRVYGEFVKNAESWFSLSFLTTKEDVLNDYFIEKYNSEGIKITPSTFDQNVTDSLKIEPGYIPRPMDQRVNLAIFFQDYIPGKENFKMHLNLLFGTGLPFGPADKKRYNDILRIPPYRRVDIGFSALLYDESKKEIKPETFLKHFESIWFGIEIFNLLQVENTVSYFWVKDITNTQYAVPNFLTSRRINGRLTIRF